MVFYLKYRPQTLDELDNSGVASLLKRYLSSKNIPHAFLFSGPRGTGKTSAARILAKSLNCPKSNTPGQACGNCDICQGIAGGKYTDILEIDAASNRGIDEIRDLREKIKLTPLALKYKVYIIDEVHMLTNEAFNALLKTLEEPPVHAVFVLATTEIHKVPGTVVSRCVMIEFHRATVTELVHSLDRIVRGEKLAVGREVLTTIATAADGSFRDGAKYLQEVALEPGEVAQDDMLQKLGTTDVVLRNQFLADLREKHTKELLILIGKLVSEGKNVRQFFLAVLEEQEKELIGLWQNQKSGWKKAELLRAIKIFSAAFAELKTAVLPQLPFELAVVEYCEDINAVHPEDKSIPDLPPGVDTHSAEPVANSFSDLGPFRDRWTEVLNALKPLNHSLVGILRSCRPVSLKDGILTIEAGYKFHADRLVDPKVRDILPQVIKEVTGLDVKIAVVGKKKI